MREWVNASVNAGFADAVLVPDLPSKTPRALITLNYHRRRWPALRVKASQIVMAAVTPDATGWLHRLVVESMLHVRGAGDREPGLPIWGMHAGLPQGARGALMRPAPRHTAPRCTGWRRG